MSRRDSYNQFDRQYEVDSKVGPWFSLAAVLLMVAHGLGWF